jgi:phospholipid/cholesterol/gamma-HCH transport system substrate-binding protein
MRTVEITVGAFMIAGIVSLLILALQVSGLANFFVSKTGYQIRAEFTNVGGLKERAKVSLAGVVVGRVTKIDLDPVSFNAIVDMVIDDREAPKLPSDTRASILTSGLLGDNYIGLSPGFDDKAYLKAGDVIDVSNTDSALLLEQLISKFVAGQATNNSTEGDKNVLRSDK